ncbi:hypothetical protein [Dictyobacter aurantiacus]|uniref:Uncharacterized protein n=1 Tax=Dictyobacter aurantiacus TaxID=1936993 RepID=A0A401ZKH0_9CHLR|nr:hypothetical protein [Dictyobacter aurantiacus]GCE07361.1 hypothetical protein KDAU_46900 [Dictyobacter aurantiacus]
MQNSSSQRRARACDFCGEGVAPLYPVVTAEVATGEEQKRLVCHTCRSLGHGRPIVASARQQEQRTPNAVDDTEDGKQSQALTAAKAHGKQSKAR